MIRLLVMIKTAFVRIFHFILRLKRPITILFERRNIRPAFIETIPDIRSWFDGPLGKRLVYREKQLLKSALEQHWGADIVVLSPLGHSLPSLDSPYRRFIQVHLTRTHCIHAEKTSPLVSEFDSLPLPDELVDIVIIQHSLEYVKEPHAVLKEASRLVKCGGHILVINFNPLSPVGIAGILGRWGRLSGFKSRRSLPAFQIRDWFNFVECTPVQSRYFSYELPISHEGFQYATHRVFDLLANINTPFANAYCVIARKDKTGMLRNRDNWEAAAMLKRALSSGKTTPAMRKTNRDSDD